MIHGQSIEPGAEARIALETAKLAVDLQEHVLEQILRFVRRPGHAVDQAVQPPRMRTIQLLECRRIALPAALRQFKVRRSHVS